MYISEILGWLSNSKYLLSNSFNLWSKLYWNWMIYWFRRLFEIPAFFLPIPAWLTSPTSFTCMRLPCLFKEARPHYLFNTAAWSPASFLALPVPFTCPLFSSSKIWHHQIVYCNYYSPSFSGWEHASSTGLDLLMCFIHWYIPSALNDV